MLLSKFEGGESDILQSRGVESAIVQSRSVKCQHFESLGTKPANIGKSCGQNWK